VSVRRCTLEADQNRLIGSRQFATPLEQAERLIASLPLDQRCRLSARLVAVSHSKFNRAGKTFLN
jgi:hypothetical protein